MYRGLKRGLDVGFSSLGLCAISPVLLVAGVAVKLDTPGPIFYRSERVGRGGRRFDLLKLRTMKTEQNPNDPQVTARNDTRITRTGKWLRKTKIDELPQFWNVFVGDVSLVGPRPEAPKYVDCYTEQYQEILNVRPGLTDRTTLEFIDEEKILGGVESPEQYYIDVILPRKIESYLEYVRRPSIREDISIVAQTAMKVFGRVMGSVTKR